MRDGISIDMAGSCGARFSAQFDLGKPFAKLGYRYCAAPVFGSRSSIVPQGVVVQHSNDAVKGSERPNVPAIQGNVGNSWAIATGFLSGSEATSGNERQ